MTKILTTVVLTMCHILLMSTGRGRDVSILHSWKKNCQRLRKVMELHV